MQIIPQIFQKNKYNTVTFLQPLRSSKVVDTYKTSIARASIDYRHNIMFIKQILEKNRLLKRFKNNGNRNLHM